MGDKRHASRSGEEDSRNRGSSVKNIILVLTQHTFNYDYFIFLVYFIKNALILVEKYLIVASLS